MLMILIIKLLYTALIAIDTLIAREIKLQTVIGLKHLKVQRKRLTTLKEQRKPKLTLVRSAFELMLAVDGISTSGCPQF
jgi:hypothetical protein